MVDQVHPTGWKIGSLFVPSWRVGKLLKEQDGNVLREGVRVLSQALMETEVAGLIGAEPDTSACMSVRAR